MQFKYAWPASRLSAKEMAMLYEARLKLKTPITELLRAAIENSFSDQTKGEEAHAKRVEGKYSKRTD